MGTGVSVVVLGARGSAPTEGAQVSRYGGGTSCVLVRMGGQVIVLDAGTGLMDLERALKPEDERIHLLLSHPHFDHMVGLPSCPVLYDPGRAVRIYAAPRAGLSPREQIARLMSPPLWPVGPEAFTARVSYETIVGGFSLGPVTVDVMEGAHPGGCTVFRLSCGGTSVVYASDCELDEESTPPLSEFARDCTLLLCDGQYSIAEFSARRGYGHSSWRSTARLAAHCGAKRLLIFHHAPLRTDAELDAARPLLAELFSPGAFARGGEEIFL